MTQGSETLIAVQHSDTKHTSYLNDTTHNNAHLFFNVLACSMRIKHCHPMTPCGTHSIIRGYGYDSDSS